MITVSKSSNLSPMDPMLLSSRVGSVFKFTKIVGERANQIVRRNRRNFEAELDMSVGEIESFSDQRESIAVKYEKQAKPVLEAIDDFVSGDLIYSSSLAKSF